MKPVRAQEQSSMIRKLPAMSMACGLFSKNFNPRINIHFLPIFIADCSGAIVG